MLSLSHRFLFVHIPKTAGNSVQNVLRAYADDEVTSRAVHQDGVERFELRSARYNTHKHSTLAEYRREYGEGLLGDVFKFASVRNPWARAVSYYFSPHRGAVVWDRTAFAQFVPTIPPVTDYLSLDGEGLAESVRNLDDLIRFESLAIDFERVCNAIGVPQQSLPVRNRSGSGAYRDYYDTGLMDLVGTHFSDEIAQFGYAF